MAEDLQNNDGDLTQDYVSSMAQQQDEPVSDVNEEVTEPAVEEPQQEVVESEPTSENAFNQEKANAAINKQHAKFREEQRRADELQKKLDDLSAQQGIGQPPQLLEAPDPFDENYEEKLKAYSESVAANARYEAQQAQLQQQQQATQQQQELQRQQEVQKTVESYVNNAKELGISQAELMEHGNNVGNYAINEDVQLMIASDPEGPLITKYLSQNAAECANIANMSPVLAAHHVLTTVKSKAAMLRPKQTNTPPPARDVSSGTGNVDSSGMKYAKGNFE